MILDRGICDVYRQVNAAQPGGKPTFILEQIFESWFGELNFETNPARPTEAREEVRTDARIRILQNRTINNHDRVVLHITGEEARHYRVTRAWHGVDDDSGEPISDPRWWRRGFGIRPSTSGSVRSPWRLCSGCRRHSAR